MKYWVLFAFTIFSTVSSLIPFLMGLKRFKISATHLKLLVVLTGVSFASDVLEIMLRYAKMNPNYVGNGYTLIEFVLLLIIYSEVFGKMGSSRLFFGLGILYTIVFLLNIFFVQQDQILSYNESFSALVFIAISIFFFYRLIKDLPALKIQRLPMFWINTAVLIFFAGNLFVFILRNYLVTVLNDDLVVYWSFHNFLGITKNVLFAIGLWQNLQTLKLR